MLKLKTKINSPVVSNVVKGSLIAVSVSLFLILIFAFLIKIFNIPDYLIKPINQVIKIMSVFIVVLFALKKLPQKGLVSGMLIGVIYTILAFLIFSFLSGKFTFSFTILIDVLCALVIGGLCGVFFVNKQFR